MQDLIYDVEHKRQYEIHDRCCVQRGYTVACMIAYLEESHNLLLMLDRGEIIMEAYAERQMQRTHDTFFDYLAGTSLRPRLALFQDVIKAATSYWQLSKSLRHFHVDMRGITRSRPDKEFLPLALKRLTSLETLVLNTSALPLLSAKEARKAYSDALPPLLKKHLNR